MTDGVWSADGERRLAVAQRGKIHGGRPVFLLHGTPGSRIGPLPREGLLYRLGVRLITYDRPGYGASDRHEGRSVGDVAADVAVIADHLGLDRFAVVGRSGGGPHALACAALIPHRVTRAAVLVGLAPREAEGLDWFDGMTEGNVAEYMTAMQGRARLAARLVPTAAEIREDPVRLVNSLYDELTESDRSVIADAGIRTMLVQNYAEAVRTSAYGWIDDAMAFCSPWGFDPADIRVPTLLWHGEDDVFSPVSHSRWLAGRIPTATVRIQRGAAHFHALHVLPDLLGWLARDGRAA
ncbi:alpha/beta fold hydrolase [Microbispora triticiradicis]|uniref:alpha/beta fold hydrolase n=1 Tax=Microbispora TaxID=2005 RepID=UPI001ABF2191|nr:MULTISPECIES: alpha/beta hydrolase [Microbispora]GLW20349.1 alpha/beta hydrolase [Microbispora amethystogenes]